MTSIKPELWVETPAEAIAFYEAAFAATVLHRVGDGDDIVAQLGVSDAAFWVARRASNDGQRPDREPRHAPAAPRRAAEHELRRLNRTGYETAAVSSFSDVSTVLT
jgi:hypothetical protein